MRRLFSSFARGAPGAGLLLMRAVTGGALIACAVAALAIGPPWHTAALHVTSAGIGCLLIVGLWTPVAATLAALIAAFGAFSHPGELGFYLLLATLGAALALLGPGAWSLDSRLFGLTRLEIRNGKRRDPPSV
jgi:putative oxidoreductase